MFVALVILAVGQTGSDPAALPTQVARPVAVGNPAREEVGLAAMEQVAWRNNPSIAQAVARFEQARGRAIQAGAYPNPLAIWTGSSLGNQGTAGTQEGFFQQPIITAGKIRVNQSRYEVDVEIARWEVWQQQLRVRNGVRLRYLEILAQQQMRELRSALLRLANDVVRTTRAKVESGHASEADLLMAENEAAQVELDLDQLRERYLNTWRELAAFLGCPSMTPSRLTGSLEGDFPTLAWEPTLARLLAESPEIRIAELEIRRQKFTLKRERIEPIPDLVVRGGGAYLPTSNQTVGYTRLYVEVPIWNRNRGNIHRAEHGLLEVRQELVRERLDLQRKLREPTTTIRPACRTSGATARRSYPRPTGL